MRRLPMETLAHRLSEISGPIDLRLPLRKLSITLTSLRKRTSQTSRHINSRSKQKICVCVVYVSDDAPSKSATAQSSGGTCFGRYQRTYVFRTSSVEVILTRRNIVSEDDLQKLRQFFPDNLLLAALDLIDRDRGEPFIRRL